MIDLTMLEQVRAIGKAAEVSGARLARIVITTDTFEHTINTRPAITAGQLWQDAPELEVLIHPTDWQEFEDALGTTIREVYGVPVDRSGSS